MDSAENFHQKRVDIVDIKFNDAIAAEHPLQPYQNPPQNTPLQRNILPQPIIYHSGDDETSYNQNMQMPNPYNQNTVSFDKCCQGVAGGFGPMYFNMRDPNLGKTNAPVKTEASLHRCVVVTNLIFLFFLCFAIVFQCIGQFYAPTMLVFIIPSYIVYLVSACCCSDIKDFIDNTKKNDQYKPIYDKMVQGQGYFTFWIECYHYTTVSTRRGTRRSKTVTHTAKQIFDVSFAEDQSGQLTSLQDDKSFIFMKYLKRFYFSNDQSEQKFKTAFNQFVARNTSDSHQNYSHTFQVQNHEEQVCFTATGDSEKTKALFYIFTLLGLAFPYSYIFESAVARYEIGILKRLTV